MEFTRNVGYGVFNEQHQCREEIYNQVGSRRNGVYGGDPRELSEMDSYSAYDIVL